MNHSFFTNAGVVVIDDKQEEVKELFDVFRRKGIPCLYYDGEDATLPESPLGRVRIIFVDLNLLGINVSNTVGVKNAASKIAGILGKIICKKNGPYAVVYWSSHSDTDVKEEFQRKLSEYSGANAPVLYCDMDKAECLAAQDKNAFIADKLSDKLKSASALQLYTEWESIVSKSAADCVRELSASVGQTANWSVETGKMFHHLYKQYVDKREVDNDEQKFRYAAIVLDMIFSDILDKNVSDFLALPAGFSMNLRGIDFETKLKLNAALLVSSDTPKVEQRQWNTGDVIVVNQQNEDMKKIFSTVKKGTVKDFCPPKFKQSCSDKEKQHCPLTIEPKLIVGVITPGCDFAQNKCLGDTSNQMLRVVYGLFYQYDNIKEPDIDKIVKSIKQGDAIFLMSPFFHNGKYCLLAFNFHTITTIWSNDATLESGYQFSLKSEIRLDLQSKAATHVNRLGHFDLGQIYRSHLKNWSFLILSEGLY